MAWPRRLLRGRGQGKCKCGNQECGFADRSMWAVSLAGRRYGQTGGCIVPAIHCIITSPLGHWTTIFLMDISPTRSQTHRWIWIASIWFGFGLIGATADRLCHAGGRHASRLGATVCDWCPFVPALGPGNRDGDAPGTAVSPGKVEIRGYLVLCIFRPVLWLACSQPLG